MVTPPRRLQVFVDSLPHASMLSHPTPKSINTNRAIAVTFPFGELAIKLFLLFLGRLLRCLFGVVCHTPNLPNTLTKSSGLSGLLNLGESFLRHDDVLQFHVDITTN